MSLAKSEARSLCCDTLYLELRSVELVEIPKEMVMKNPARRKKSENTTDDGRPKAPPTANAREQKVARRAANQIDRKSGGLPPATREEEIRKRASPCGRRKGGRKASTGIIGPWPNMNSTPKRARPTIRQISQPCERPRANIPMHSSSRRISKTRINAKPPPAHASRIELSALAPISERSPKWSINRT